MAKAKVVRLVIGILCACVALAGCGESEKERKAAIDRMEPWQMLAKLDGVSHDELKSARIRTLLDRLSAAYGEPPNVIGDKTYVTQQSLKEKGIGESLLEVLEAMNRTANLRGQEDKYAEHLAVYTVLRSSGQSSADAVAAMDGLNLHVLISKLKQHYNR